MTTTFFSTIYKKKLTVLNPPKSPNTDGIDPDSVSNMTIMNFFYIGGDDAIAIKSGWDCFGIEFNTPSKNILIKNMVSQHSIGG